MEWYWSRFWKLGWAWLIPESQWHDDRLVTWSIRENNQKLWVALSMRQLLELSFDNLLKKWVEKLEKIMARLERKKKYTTEPRYITSLEDIQSSRKEVGNLWVNAPFLEDRQIEPWSKFSVKKIETTKKRTFIEEIQEEVELPPDPIELKVVIPSELLKRIVKSDYRNDYYKNVKFFFHLINSLSDMLNEHVGITLLIEWKQCEYDIDDKRLLDCFWVSTISLINNVEKCLYLSCNSCEKKDNCLDEWPFNDPEKIDKWFVFNINARSKDNSVVIDVDDFQWYKNDDWDSDNNLDISHSLNNNMDRMLELIIKSLVELNYFSEK